MIALPDVTSQADSAAASLGSGSWMAKMPSPSGAGSDCGDGLSGFAADVMRFVQPLREMLQVLSGDPGGLYQASIAWETGAGTFQNASEQFARAAEAAAASLSGNVAEVLETVCRLLTLVAHSMGDWCKVMSQVLQLCVRVVEILRSLVCAGFELLSSVGGLAGEVAFGSWPWELDKKAEAIRQFAENCRQVIETVKSNVERAIQAVREMMRLVLDLGRAIFPIHEQIEQWLASVMRDVDVSGIPVVRDIPGLMPDGRGETGPPPMNPYPDSDHAFSREFPHGYQHQYTLGPTSMTTEELNAMFRQQFGHIFTPGRVGDNSQIDAQLTHEGQIIETQLFGNNLPGITQGDIQVTQITEDGFVIRAQDGHPEAGGEVAFRIRNVDGQAVFEVTGAYDQTILDAHGFQTPTNPAFAWITDNTVWSDTSSRMRDAINYGK